MRCIEIATGEEWPALNMLLNECCILNNFAAIWPLLTSIAGGCSTRWEQPALDIWFLLRQRCVRDGARLRQRRRYCRRDTATHSTDSSGLTLSESPPINATATVELDGRLVSEIWAELSSSDGSQAELIEAALDAGQGRTYHEYHDRLEEASIGALYGFYRSLVV